MPLWHKRRVQLVCSRRGAHTKHTMEDGYAQQPCHQAEDELYSRVKSTRRCHVVRGRIDAISSELTSSVERFDDFRHGGHI